MTYPGLSISSLHAWQTALVLHPQSSFKEELASKQAVGVKFLQEFFTPRSSPRWYHLLSSPRTFFQYGGFSLSKTSPDSEIPPGQVWNMVEVVCELKNTNIIKRWHLDRVTIRKPLDPQGSGLRSGSFEWFILIVTWKKCWQLTPRWDRGLRPNDTPHGEKTAENFGPVAWECPSPSLGDFLPPLCRHRLLRSTRLG